MVEKLNLLEEVERDIVSLSLDDTNFFFDIYEFLKPSHLRSEVASKSWAIIKTFFKEYHRLPKKYEVRQHLKTLYDIEVGDDYFQSDKTVRDRTLNDTLRLIRESEFKKFIFKAAEEADKKNPDYAKLENDLKKILKIEPISDLGLFYFDVDERFERIKSSNKNRIATGIPIVDRCLKGGVAAGELIAFAAPTGIGKSYLLTIAGANMLVNGKKNVLHYTFEMSEEVTSIRYDMACLHKTDLEIMIDISETKEQIKKISEEIEKNLVIKEFPTKGANVNTIRTHLQKLQEHKGFIPDVIIVDYGDIMLATRKYNSRYDEQGAIFQELRGLAQELKVPILTATQTNRNSLTKTIIDQEDISDSFDKIRILDAMFTITQSREDAEDGIIKIYEAKVRNSARGKVYAYKLDYSRAKLEEIGEINPDED